MKKILIIFIFALSFVVIPPYSQAAADPGFNFTFDALPGVTPKILPTDGKLPVELNVKIDLAKYQNYCNMGNLNSFKFSVYADSGHTITNDVNLFGPKTETFQRTGTVNQTYKETILIQNNGTAQAGYTYRLYAWIECPNGTNVSNSKASMISVQVGSGDVTYACAISDSGSSSGYSYSCSLASLPDCTDNIQCAGKQCLPIRKSLCGSPAPAPGTGPGGGAVCGNNSCEQGEDQTSCPADCKPGQEQTYSFEIPNPLKGGASDFTSLVKIIAQWIFNLAIPIAVAMIVYAGILFLTAAGEPAKVTKAKDVLKWAVVGLAIILIGSGFVTLIQSILELGGTSPTPTESVGPSLCVNGVCINGVVGPCRDSLDCIQTAPLGAVGNKCSKDNNCSEGLKCKNKICQRKDGNQVDEPCISGSNCAKGLDCNLNPDQTDTIDGQTVGFCYQTQ